MQPLKRVQIGLSESTAPLVQFPCLLVDWQSGQAPYVIASLIALCSIPDSGLGPSVQCPHALFWSCESFTAWQFFNGSLLSLIVDCQEGGMSSPSMLCKSRMQQYVHMASMLLACSQGMQCRLDSSMA